MADDPIKLLLVEDEDDFRDSCVRWMQRKGHDVSAAASGAEALSLCEEASFEVAVFDMNMPGMSGMELLQRVQQDKLDMEVIILTGQGTIDLAVEAMKLGACDFLTKPCTLGDLEHRCQLARDRGRLRRENKHLKEIISRGKPDVDIVGESPAMKQVVKMIHKVAPTDSPVLIQGESGTGKEVAARAIQQQSQLADKPFVTINCAALPEQLVESELFGHTKGSFTGATSEKPGLFEIADGGTLFIDEIGELPLALQPKLLRVLEDGSMRRIGSAKQRHVRVRIIAATNRDLAAEVAEGRFREDLYYRVNVLSITLPPLRERQGDIDRLIDHFLPVPWEMEEDARRALNAYHWPGNVRQLINVIQRATIMADGSDITLDDLHSDVVGVNGHQVDVARNSSGERGAVDSGPDRPSECVSRYRSQPVSRQAMYRGKHGSGGFATLDDVAKNHVMRVLESENGNKAKSARVLGIHRRKLYRLLERYENPQSDAASEETI